ncbi:MAG: hypothetical protein GY941_21875, partial [Planctomycetes bacterium]|nr:hypothetical protein [Planctomycetota bacterium]
EKVFPGVGYLEMARAAVEKASGEIEEGTTIHLKNVVWAQPIVVDGSDQKVHIGLYGEDDCQIQYEVYTEAENEEESIVHSQGVAEFKVKEEVLLLDIQDLQSQMNQGTLNGEKCYQAFKGMGIEYGEGHRGIREIYQGENQLLARLSLPTSVQDTQSDYVLHPSLMDSALQSSIGLILNNGTLPDSSGTLLEPSLPFTLESLEILSSCTSEMYALIHYSSCSAISNKVQRLDIDLCDEQGNVCVKMQGLTLQELEITSQGFEITSQGFEIGSQEFEKMFQDQKTVELSPPSTDFEIYSSSTETLQEELKTSLAKALYMKESDIDLEKPFIEMGVDSIVGVEWVKTINQEYKTNITASKVYDYPNIGELANYLQKHLGKLTLTDQSSKKLKGVAFDTNQHSLSNSPNQLIENLGICVNASSLRSIRRRDRIRYSNVHNVDTGNSSHYSTDLLSIRPENLGNPLFQTRYQCKWSYFAGSMYKKIASEELVVRMSKARLLSFFGSAGLTPEELEESILSIQSQLEPNQPYGMCLISNIHNSAHEMKQVELFIQYHIPVIEVAAFATISLPLVYCRIKGLSQKGDQIGIPRYLIGKCSRLEVARLFLSPPPLNIVHDLLQSQLISPEEAAVSQYIPMVDDLAIEADS